MPRQLDNSLFNAFNKTFKQRTSKGLVWLTLKDFPLWIKTAIWALGLEKQKDDFRRLGKAINSLLVVCFKRRNYRFAFNYLKGCYNIVVAFLAGQRFSDLKVRISLDKDGLPRIIPINIRAQLSSREFDVFRNVIGGCLTFLSVYRIIKWFPKIDLSSISDPFSGTTRSIDSDLIRRSLELLGKSNKLYHKGSGLGFLRRSVSGFKPDLILSEKAGPNCGPSTLSCWFDAFAFLHQPRLLWSIIMVNFHYRSIFIPLWLLTFLIIWSPVYALCVYVFHIWPKSNLGRLSVVYDQAGKSRIVGITNWWIQVTLLPVHKGIFKFLRDLPEDGTFDQLSPLLDKGGFPKDQTLYSFDLSSATDRLPIDVQENIMSYIFGSSFSCEWRHLVSIPFEFNGRKISYSVGQPMGAYSSWALLALAHHVLVKASAIRSGLSDTKDYAILGDDIVIWNDSVSESYLMTMKSLGVSISLPKTIISSDILEFAKKIFTNTLQDLSPIGPGLILATVRRREMLGTLLSASITQGFYKLSSSFDILKSITLRHSPQVVALILWQCFGLRGLLVKTRSDALVKRGLDWFNLIISREQRYALFAAMLSQLLNHYGETVIRLEAYLPFMEQARGYTYACYKLEVSSSNLPWMLYLAFFVSSPAFFTYWRHKWRSIWELADFGSFNGPGAYLKLITWRYSAKGMKELIDRSIDLGLYSVDFGSSREAGDALKSLKKLDKYFAEHLLDYLHPSENHPLAIQAKKVSGEVARGSIPRTYLKRGA